VKRIAGEYWVGPWRIGPPSNPPDAATFTEKILLCDRTIVSRDAHQAVFGLIQERERLRLLLNVFWLHQFYDLPMEHVWTFEPWAGEGALMSRMA
jgi:hypothetical protein